MAVKTFSGTTLASSDVNTYLANSGLVWVKEVTLSSTATDLTTCFSASYDAYRLVITNLSNASGAFYLQYQLLSGTSPSDVGYNGVRHYVNPSSGYGYFSFSDSRGTMGAFGTAGINPYSVDIYNPYNALYTSVASQGMYDQNNGVMQMEHFISAHLVDSSYDGIRFLLSGGSFASGKVVCYGYRKS